MLSCSVFYGFVRVGMKKREEKLTQSYVSHIIDVSSRHVIAHHMRPYVVSTKLILQYRVRTYEVKLHNLLESWSFLTYSTVHTTVLIKVHNTPRTVLVNLSLSPIVPGSRRSIDQFASNVLGVATYL
jgi:hypothetical protein